jgi:hypothetical protein
MLKEDVSMQTKHTTQKYMASLVGLGLIMAAPVTSHAFTSQQVVTETAQATVTGGSAAMNIALLTVGTNAPATAVGWNAPTAGGGWQMASQYLQINSTLTVTGAGIQTYTKNKSSGANPLYTALISTFTPGCAGLVAPSGTSVLPVAWQVSTGTALAADEPNAASIPGRTGFAWNYYQDAAQNVASPNFGITSPFANGATQIEVEIAGNPPQIQFAQGSFGNSTSNVNNVYLEANFNNALGGDTYKTSTLTVELFTQ